MGFPTTKCARVSNAIRSCDGDCSGTYDSMAGVRQNLLSFHKNIMVKHGHRVGCSTHVRYLPGKAD
jgi:hypothetical protein